MTELTKAEVDWFASVVDRVENELGRVVFGQRTIGRLVLVCLFSGGHALLEGPPGIGKTLLARTLARLLGVGFKRIQFTPDLMPSDVTGGNVLDQRSGEFEFRPGPLFTQLVLADEINRAPAKTQSALLEAMSDRQVTVDGATRRLPGPFFVVATQNPIESEGTYPLPEAQVDRFLMKILLEHPTSSVERSLLESSLRGFDAAELERVELPVLLDAQAIGRAQAACRAVQAEPQLLDYIVALVGRTRAHPAVALGASPRASIAILRACQVVAAMEGRTYVVPDDIKEVALPSLRHRFLLQPDAELEGVSPDDVVKGILSDLPVPGGNAA